MHGLFVLLYLNHTFINQTNSNQSHQLHVAAESQVADCCHRFNDILLVY